MIRKAEGKRIGTIVIPVFIDEAEDADHVLSKSAFKPVWQVLKALRAHDRRLADELDQLRLSLGRRSKSGGRINLPDNIHLDVPRLLLHDFEQAFYVRTVEQTTDKPLLTIEQILAWADGHHARTGQWPRVVRRSIDEAPDETWNNIDQALRIGFRGLPGDSSLAQLLNERRGVRNQGELPALNEEQILTWADMHKKRSGKWPTRESGSLDDVPGEAWRNIDASIRQGQRSLAGGSSLAQLLAEERGVRNHLALSRLTKEQILAWADAHLDRTGEWPKGASGPIFDATGETWKGIQMALLKGLRGLPGGSSLARLLAEERAVRNQRDLQPLTATQILKWADGYYERAGQWPQCKSGPVINAPGETWTGIDNALRKGGRGVPGGSSLALLLAAERGVKNIADAPTLDAKSVLALADAHYQSSGQWPTVNSGIANQTTRDTWRGIDRALRCGNRGLPGGSSLAQLLCEQRGVRNTSRLPPLTKEQILIWADRHHDRTGEWPNTGAGPVVDAPDETWTGISRAFREGQRGLPAGSSLAKLLEQERGARNRDALPQLTKEKIVEWADSHYNRTGEWPKSNSGPIPDAQDESWQGINGALTKGQRGLPKGSSLAQLLAAERQVQHHLMRPQLTDGQILLWSDQHYMHTGKWPRCKSGVVTDAPSETWSGLNAALERGLRGLPGGCSLAKLLAERRCVQNRANLPPLTVEKILGWADLHHARTGTWPKQNSGCVEDAQGENWTNLASALRVGLRGLSGGSSLASLIKEHRGRPKSRG